MPADPLAEYFTPERLKRLRKLRKRFPHWCLDWPSVAEVRAVVTPSHRLSMAVQEMRDDLKVWEGFPRLGDDVRCEAWMEGKTACVRVIELDYSDDEIGEGQVDVDVPAAHFALFASIAHTLSSLRSSLERDYLIREWMDQIEGILVSDPRQSEKRDKLLKLAARARHASARAAQSCPIRERDGREARARAAGDALKSYWQAIGQDIGLIPTRRGGKSDLIPEDWLSELANQARDLVAEVRRYQPDTANRVAVRTLLLAPPYPAGSRGNRIIAEHRLKDGRSPDDAYSSWDKQVGLNDWCLCLAFPMLTRKEIKDAKKNRAWLWLPAKRLGMSENTLSKRKTS